MSYAERLAADIPGAELEIVPDGGHFLMEDAPGVVVDRILAFLQRVGADSGSIHAGARN